jgi:DNA (cytosine-5)-methyltransferase 1
MRVVQRQPQPSRRPAVRHHRSVPVHLGRHPDAPDPADLRSVRSWVSADDGRPTAIDLFCGAGGLSLGLEQAGFRVLVGADSDPWAVRTHEANVGGLGWTGDLRSPDEFLQTLAVWGIARVDLIAGGVPCQPFSRAGRSRIRELIAAGERADHDVRATLWESFMVIVRHLRPPAVLVENVPDLPTWDDGAVLTGFFESLRELGYRVDARVVEAWRHGVPQHRQRLLLVGLDGGRTVRWPSGDSEPVTLAQAIGDLPIIPPAQRAERLRYPDPPGTDFQRRMREGVPEDERNVVWDHISRDVRPDDHRAFEILEPGGTYADLPSDLQRYRTDIFTDKYRRLAWNELSRSITAHIAKDGYWYIHPSQHRTLSIREAARLQTFPDWFRFAGNQTHRYHQIGNAVPPVLGAVIGRALLQALAAPNRVTNDDPHVRFRRTLLAWHAERGAPLPWRSAGDPWLALAGELLGQRARRAEALAAYEMLSRIGPTPAAAHKRSEELVRALDPLGMAARGRLVTDAAAAVVQHFRGELPGDELALRSLPAVGDYVAQAALCFGFGRRATLVDSTTSRVSTRIHQRSERRRFQLRLDLHRLAGPAGPDAVFNAALLELGTTLCLPEQPRCAECPVRSHCARGRDEPIRPQMSLVGI